MNTDLDLTEAKAVLASYGLKEVGGGKIPPIDLPRADRDDGDMERRLTALENFAEKAVDRLTAIETRLTKLDTRSETFASKEDLHRELHSLSWKLALLCTSLTAAVYFIARNVH